MIKILALRERFAHMSTVSGYDALYQHIPAGIEIDSVFCNFKKRYPRGLGRVLGAASRRANGSTSYNAHSVEAEIKMIMKAALKKYDVIHYCYGEPYLGFGSRAFVRNKATLIITNHQPVSWWHYNEGFFEKYRYTDAVITLSAYDEAYFNDRLPGKATCIPHGVDTKFYRPFPSEVAERPFTLIFSGRYLRDTITLCRTIKNISSMSLQIKFVIVYPKPESPEMLEIAALPNITWHTDVAGQQLLSLYQNADCCLIPLEDCTANNALLEAMACGLPVISTDLPAIHTYVDDTTAMLGRKSNAGDLSEAILSLYDNRDKLRLMGIAARQKAVACFDWNIIAGKTLGLFKQYHE